MSLKRSVIFHKCTRAVAGSIHLFRLRPVSLIFLVYFIFLGLLAISVRLISCFYSDSEAVIQVCQYVFDMLTSFCTCSLIYTRPSKAFLSIWTILLVEMLPYATSILEWDIKPYTLTHCYKHCPVPLCS